MAAYVLDVLEGGHVIAPRDDTGRLMTKPPLLAWLGAGSSLLLGGVSPVSLYLPSALATLGAAWLIFLAGGAVFGRDGGLFGAVMYLLSQAAEIQLATTRYDGLFAFTIALAAMAAFRAWTGAASWAPFWVAAAAATMTKGPLGVVLAAGGLAAAVWDRPAGGGTRSGGHAMGLAVFTAIAGGWLALALTAHGREVVDALLLGELVRHAVGRAGSAPFGQQMWQPALDVTTRFLPWMALTAAGMWRVLRSPAAQPIERRFERFVFAWFWVGLVIFSLAAHHRQRHILPLVVPAALLAGQELARWLSSWPARRRLAAVTAVAILWLIGTGIDLHLMRGNRPGVRHTAAMRDAARSARAALGEGVPLTHLDSPFAFRFYLGDLASGVSADEAARFLARDTPVFVAASASAPLAPGAAARTIWRWPATGDAEVMILSNRPRPDRADGVAFVAGAFAVEVAGADVAPVRRRELAVRPHGASWSVAVQNRSPRAEPITVRRADTWEEWSFTLAPGAARRLP